MSARYRKDPEVEAPVDGAPEHSQVTGKDPNFEYLWATKDELSKRLSSRGLTVGTGHLAKKVVLKPWAKCVAGQEDAEEFAGYGSIRSGEGVSTDIENGELVLLKRPISERKKLDAANEDINRSYDKRIHGEVAAMRAQGVPVNADVSEQILKSE